MPEAKMFVEKRANPRFSVKLPIHYRLMKGKKELHAIEEWRKTGNNTETMDLSLGGMQLAVDQRLLLGSLLRFDIDLPTRQNPLAIFAEVMWSNDSGAGLRFLMIKPEDLQSLKSYLETSSNL